MIGNLSAREIRQVMRRRWNRDTGYALAFEVADQCGYDATRRLDAVAIGLWTSTQLQVHAFEIKVSRADLLRELRNPGKALTAARFCDTFSLVVPKGVRVGIDALPPEWGLYRILHKARKARTWNMKTGTYDPPGPREAMRLWPQRVRAPKPLAHAPSHRKIPGGPFGRRRPDLTHNRSFVAAFLAAMERERAGLPGYRLT